ncbi:MAG: lycopene cyclase family protein [Gordonia sp. (in: high G+C Gram-positive bacteria)]|uniref:lycopene cyclase family protein n=1 Tax=Gordonia sp. (in: high G+C Gram-positive bacteria) TaxID=84139 RepID=UPI003BB6394F
MTDLLIVGAGPAGRALAHRGLAHGLSVTVIDPDPDRAWTATIGAFTDDLPDWLDDDVIACAAPQFVVYTPQRRTVDRAYGVFSPTRLQAALSLAGAVVERIRVSELGTDRVRLADGRMLRARHVIDTRGGWSDNPDLPRQRAYGTVHPRDAADHSEMVLMDWRETPEAGPSFSYRVALGDGTRLIEETCLAGRPAVLLTELARRNELRSPDPKIRVPEEVDFPLYLHRTPWRHTGALQFGAAGGLMHPATGYSIAASLATADDLAAAIATGRDPRQVLWPAGARWTHRLRMIGLGVLLTFRGRELREFFDAFFALPLPTQRAYLNDRHSVRGTLAAMWAVFRALGWQQRTRVIRSTVAAVSSASAFRPAARPVFRRWPSRRRVP